MNSGEWWTILQDRHLSRPPVNELSLAVKHSMGRGKFKEMANAVTVPELVLDRIIKSHRTTTTSGFWTDEPPRANGNLRHLPADPRVGGADYCAANAKGWMRGVHVETETQPKPKVSGRARALNLRTKKLLEQQPRRPGCLVTAKSQESWRLQRSPGEAVQPERDGQPPPSCDDDLDSVTSALSGSSLAAATMAAPSGNSAAAAAAGSVLSRSGLGQSYAAAVVASSQEQPPLTTQQQQLSYAMEFPDLNGSGKSEMVRTSPPLARYDAGSLTECSSSMSLSESVSLEISDEAGMFNEKGQADEDGTGIMGYNYEMNWKIDERTLLFTDLPSEVTKEEIIDSVEPLGEVTNCSIVRKMAAQEKGSKHNQTFSTSAIVRMKEESTCEWVISCFHDNTFENSESKVHCKYALPRDK